MSNRRKTRQERQRFALEKFFRPSCSDCGSTWLVWCTVAETDDPEHWAQGLGLTVEDARECAVWECQDCSHGGAFGPTEVF